MAELFLKGIRINYLHKLIKTRAVSNNKTLFIHGSGGNASLWEKVMDNLAINDWETIAVSLPGHGEPMGHGMTSIKEYREFIKEFLKVGPLKMK